MSKRRPLGEPGAVRPAMENTCGYDAGITGGPICGKPATWHLVIGSPEMGAERWGAVGCDDHAVLVKDISWDWHAMSGVCDVPGTLWQHGKYQGEGFCFWPEAEAAMHEAVAQTGTRPRHATSHTSLT